jgi:hypothetical protein
MGERAEPMMQMDFPDLCRRCPAIAELKADAASIALHEHHPWYEHWLAGSQIFARAVAAAAVALNVPAADVRDVALDGLLDTYWTARRRRAKREAAA